MKTEEKPHTLLTTFVSPAAAAAHTQLLAFLHLFHRLRGSSLPKASLFIVPGTFKGSVK